MKNNLKINILSILLVFTYLDYAYGETEGPPPSAAPSTPEPGIFILK